MCAGALQPTLPVFPLAAIIVPSEERSTAPWRRKPGRRLSRLGLTEKGALAELLSFPAWATDFPHDLLDRIDNLAATWRDYWAAAARIPERSRRSGGPHHHPSFFPPPLDEFRAVYIFTPALSGRAKGVLNGVKASNTPKR
jgi:hypothetical protein